MSRYFGRTCCLCPSSTRPPWTVCDYPLVQAVEDRIVKAPLIVTREDDPAQPAHDPDHITRENVCEKYGYLIHAAVQRWQ